MLNDSKILFIDFDGVLNSFDNMRVLYSLHDQTKGTVKSMDSYGHLFDDRCVKWLRYIVSKTDCKIVVSSSWKTAGLDRLRLMFYDRKIDLDIVGITPNIENSIRGKEIQKYIDKHNITNYCILDDHNDMLDSQMDRFVQCDGNFGLTHKEVKKVIEVLNGKTK